MIVIALVILSIIAIIASLIGYPRFATYVLVPSLPLQTIRYRLHQFPLGASYIDIMLIAIFLGVMLHRREPVLPQNKLYKYLGLLSILLFVSLWYGSFYQHLPLPLWITDERLSDWKNLVVLPAVFFAALATIRTPKQMKVLLLLMGISLLATDKGFGGTFTASQITHFSYDGRQSGPFGYAGVNGIAAFFGQAMLFLLGYLAFERSLVRKAIIWGVLAYTGFNLLYTFSRGAYIALLLGLVVLGVLKERKYLIYVTVFLFAWQTVVPRAVYERVATTYEKGEGLEASAEERVTIWDDALDVITHSPIVGAGFDTYKFMHRVMWFEDTHNYYLKVLLETGIAGLLCFLYLLVKLFGAAWKLYSSSKDPFFRGLSLGLILWLSGAVIANLFGDRWTYIEISGYMWAILAMVIRATYINSHAAACSENAEYAQGNTAQIISAEPAFVGEA